MKIIILLAALLLPLRSHAQTWFQVSSEGASAALSPVVTLPAGTVFRFGTPNCTATSPAAPAWASQTVAADGSFTLYYPAGSFTFPDPCPGVAKELDVAEFVYPRVIQVAATPGAMQFALTVPASIPDVCAVPTTFNANPLLPAAPTICPQLPGVTALAADGNTVVDWDVSTPLIFQYCDGSSQPLCAPPFMAIGLPIAINPSSAWLGGNPNLSAASRTLFVLRQVLPNTVVFTHDGDASATRHSVTIPVKQ